MNILSTILERKRIEIGERRSTVSTAMLEAENLFNAERRSLYQFLLDPAKTGIIAEFKRRSPSKGWINKNADVNRITEGYARFGASAISVLTDDYFFGGSFSDLVVARTWGIPVLQKDFIIDEYQLVEARARGADAVLLVAACLSPAEVKHLASFANALGLEVLLELHDETELGHICEETRIVGVNNRNLRNFAVDIDNSLRIADAIEKGKLKVAESGINSVEMIMRFRTKGFHGFLIGEYFMYHADPASAFEEFVKELKLHYAS
jgi:indole-3-glycerol phosphate synthase